jgi:flagellar motility protein MotE (MotC chaperone)
MIQWARDFRLIPIVLLAMVSLFALKVSGLVFDGGYTLAERLQQRNETLQIAAPDSVPDHPKIVVAGQESTPADPMPRQSWAQEMFNYRDGNNRDITGSVEGSSKPEMPPLKVSKTKPSEIPKLEVGGTSISIEPGRFVSAGERAVLERLRDRSKELDARNREIEMRENLLKAAEKRVEAKVAELKDLESRVNSTIDSRDKAERARFKSLVSMYENMKSKDAARIFDRLDLKILVEVTTQMNPRKMSEILAQMSPDAAERLTVELANRSSPGTKPQGVNQLPKIEGKPSGS